MAVEDEVKKMKGWYGLTNFISEVQDEIMVMVGMAPKMESVDFGKYHMSMDENYAVLHANFANIRDKVGEERYAKILELSEQSRALFLADPDETNGKTMEGIQLLWAIDALLEDARGERYRAGILDEEGMLTGD